MAPRKVFVIIFIDIFGGSVIYHMNSLLVYIIDGI